jgi:DNA-binding response OmpR family regulator
MARILPLSLSNVSTAMEVKLVSKSVLIVDDERLIARTLASALAEAGFEAQTASNAEVAEKIAAEEAFDLVIVDNRLPKGSGLGLLKKLKAGNAETKVILMTAFDSPETKAEAKRLGVQRYITKPFDLDRMIAEVEALVGPGR